MIHATSDVYILFHQTMRIIENSGVRLHHERLGH